MRAVAAVACMRVCKPAIRFCAFPFDLVVEACIGAKFPIAGCLLEGPVLRSICLRFQGQSCRLQVQLNVDMAPRDTGVMVHSHAEMAVVKKSCLETEGLFHAMYSLEVLQQPCSFGRALLNADG